VEQYQQRIRVCPFCEEKLGENWRDHFHALKVEGKMIGAVVEFDWFVCIPESERLEAEAGGDITVETFSPVSFWLPRGALYSGQKGNNPAPQLLH